MKMDFKLFTNEWASRPLFGKDRQLEQLMKHAGGKLTIALVIFTALISIIRLSAMNSDSCDRS